MIFNSNIILLSHDETTGDHVMIFNSDIILLSHLKALFDAKATPTHFFVVIMDIVPNFRLGPEQRLICGVSGNCHQRKGNESIKHHGRRAKDRKDFVTEFVLFF
jgi:hypothetical protein